MSSLSESHTESHTESAPNQPPQQPASMEVDPEEQEVAEYNAIVARTSAEEKLTLGRSYVKSGQTSRAVDLLARALEAYVKKYGDFSLHCALVYRSYGAALLAHYQANSSVLGEAITKDQDKTKKALGDVGAPDEDVDEDERAATDDGAKGGEGGEEDEEAENEDLALAYQVLETARVIYARHYDGPGKVTEEKANEEGARLEEEKEQAAAAAASGTPLDTSLPNLTPSQIALDLSYTYELLGGVFLEREDFASAYDDYKKALQLAEPHTPAHSKDLAAIHMDLAACAFDDPEIARDHYNLGLAILQTHQKWLQSQIDAEIANPTPVEFAEERKEEPSPSSANPSSTPVAPQSALDKLKQQSAEITELIDETQERIDDISRDLALPENQRAMALLKQHTQAEAHYNENPFAPKPADYNQSSSTPAAAASSSSTNEPTVTHAPQVKKRAPKPAATTPTTAAAASSEAVVDRSEDTDGSAAKRVKV